MAAAKHKAKKKKPKKRARRRPVFFVSPEWQRAGEDIAAAFAAQEIRASFGPFGEAAPELTNKTLKRAVEQNQFVCGVIRDDLPEAMQMFDASHPPCQPHPDCYRFALLDVAAHNMFEAGIYKNPTIAFRMMRSVVDRYMKGRS